MHILHFFLPTLKKKQTFGCIRAAKKKKNKRKPGNPCAK